MWSKQMSALITLLTTSLKRTVLAVDRFVYNHVERIDDQMDRDLSLRLQGSVGKIMGLRDQLEKVLDGLQALQSQVETFHNQASTPRSWWQRSMQLTSSS